MITELSTQRGALATSGYASKDLLAVKQVAESIKEGWRRNDQPPDAAAALAANPELRRFRTVFLDLAHEEYNHRLQAGEEVDVEAFSRRFPSFQRSLHFYIFARSIVAGEQSPVNISLWPEPGVQFLEFDLLAEIGRGSFGRVFLATEPALGGRQVVVKVAPHGGEEADILGRLRHPNIVPVYSVQKSPTGLTAFCMPYTGQATLCDVLDYAFSSACPPSAASVILDAIAAVDAKSEFVETQEPDAILRNGSYVNGVLHLAIQFADALAHSHNRGVCHRDLKPSNVLMTSDGRPLILDFNLSVDRQMPAAKIGGTVPYMAPEELAVLFDESHDVARRCYDPRSDLFSLGVILYELLTGHLPFGSLPWKPSLEECARELHERQKLGPRPIRELNGQVDLRLASLIESCLAFIPDRRLETADELAEAFRGELALTRRCRRWMGNHRKIVAATATAFLTLILATTLFLGLRPPYSDRQLRLGLAYYAQGQYPLAIECLNKAILANPASAELLSARARAYQRLGEFQTAYQDYDLAYQMSHDPTLNVCKGYCLSQIKSHKAAMALYTSAINANYDSPVVLYNNLGYSCLMLGQLDNAESYLRKAVRLNGNLQAPHYNLARVFLRRALNGKRVDNEAFVHAAKAIEIGPRAAELYQVIASLHARVASHDSASIAPAIENVGKAIELGLSPRLFNSDPTFSVLQNEPAFHAALRRPVLERKSQKVSQLLDPLSSL